MGRGAERVRRDWEGVQDVGKSWGRGAGTTTWGLTSSDSV
jgi:hypothetical protein